MICGVVLAAGESTRMGGFPKPLLHFDGDCFVEHILADLAAAGIETRIVVIGHEREEVMARASLGEAVIVDNPDYEAGMLSSVQAGVRAARDADADALLLWPTDFPVAGEDVVRCLREIFVDDPEVDVIVPAIDGERGHPALFTASTFDDLLSAPADEGARTVVYDEATTVRELSVDDERVLVDVDTPGEYWDVIKRYT
jgi:molybdenum cofactor cytidylyltransferase